MGRLKTHGEIGTYLYRAWTGMKSRCLNPSNKDYRRYGGRGITVHPAWQADYAKFAAYVRGAIGERPTSKHSLDRIDNNAGYAPGNLRWATAKEQAWNRRGLKILTHHGRGEPQAEWARTIGLPKSTLYNRLCRGWSDADAIDTEVQEEILLTYLGRTQNLSQWANELGIAVLTLYGRIVLRKWSIEKALTTKPRPLIPRNLTYLGTTLSIAEWARKLGVPQGRIYSRKARGWSDSEALTEPARETKQAR
jgi:hypothetical protein